MAAALAEALKQRRLHVADKSKTDIEQEFLMIQGIIFQGWDPCVPHFNCGLNIKSSRYDQYIVAT